MAFIYQNEKHYINTFRKIWLNKGWSNDDFAETEESISLIYQVSKYNEFIRFQKKIGSKDILDQCTSFVKFNNDIDNDIAMDMLMNVAQDSLFILKAVYQNESIIKTDESISLFLNNNQLNAYKSLCLINKVDESQNIYNLGEKTFNFLLSLSDKKVFGVYFLYNESHDLIYIGKSVSIMSRLLSQIRNYKPCSFKIAYPNTVSDMHVYEMYFISMYKPHLNVDSKSNDELSIELPEIEFSETVNIYE